MDERAATSRTSLEKASEIEEVQLASTELFELLISVTPALE